MGKFAKLFEVGKHQVLVTFTVEEEHDGNAFDIAVRTDFKGHALTATYGHLKKKDAMEHFNSFDQQDAVMMQERLTSTLKKKK